MRRATQLAAFLFVWPLITALCAASTVRQTSLFVPVPTRMLLLGCAVVVVRMWREFLVTGLLLAAVTALASRVARSGPVPDGRARHFCLGLVEAAFSASSLGLGVCLVLPAALNHPASPLRGSSVLVATLATAGVAMGLALVLRVVSFGSIRTGRALGVAAALAMLGAVLARDAPGDLSRAYPRTRVLLGLDSISQEDEVEPLRRFTSDRGGTWYEHPVTPALLTNAVWTAILTGRAASETGVYFVFQSPDWARFPDNLVARANEAGCRTISFFSDQFTTHVGSDAPFLEDRSGPRGWMQVGSAAVKDASVFLPIVLPHLPQLPGATPANQSGTYAYSLRRELSEILASGSMDSPTLAIAHLDYLHQPRFPGYAELSPAERRRVLGAAVRTLVDRSMDWQHVDSEERQPVALFRHKLAVLQRTLREIVDGTRFLATEGNALVVISDHGLRAGIDERTFGSPRYHRVLLATFGIQARDRDTPISLRDIGALLGLAHSPPASPEVAFVAVDSRDWEALRPGARLLRNGSVRLDPEVLSGIGRRLVTFVPFTDGREYRATPTAPAPEREDRPELLPAGFASIRHRTSGPRT